MTRLTSIDHEAALWCPIVELRRYTLHPGTREDLISLFDSEFIETQEAVGLTVMGQFRDIDDPDAFVWLRGFAGMDERKRGLAAFYDGPVWGTHRDRANATMIDSDNVLLLRPAGQTSGFSKVSREDNTPEQGASPCFLAATIYYLKRLAEATFLRFFERELIPALRETGVSVDAYYTTEPSPNNFPRLPVREDSHVLVWFSRCPDSDAFARSANLFQRRGSDVGSLNRRLPSFLSADAEILRLSPTARSRIQV